MTFAETVVVGFAMVESLSPVPGVHAYVYGGVPLDALPFNCTEENLQTVVSFPALAMGSGVMTTEVVSVAVHPFASVMVMVKTYGPPGGNPDTLVFWHVTQAMVPGPDH